MNLSLETERLFIRPLVINDTDFIIQLLNTKGWIQFIGDKMLKTPNLQLSISKEFYQTIGFFTMYLKSKRLTPLLG